jgi:tetratricopeptide (TPR) repeat protein
MTAEAHTQTEKLIGDAWTAHRSGQHEMALARFRQILTTEPENVDALYGLGLVQKKTGDRDGSNETFQKLQHILADLMEHELTTGQRGRYFMLTNMVRQQLAQIGQLIS